MRNDIADVCISSHFRGYIKAQGVNKPIVSSELIENLTHKMQSSVLVVLLSCAVLASASVLVSSGQTEEPANRQIPNVLRFVVTPKTITSTVTVSSTTVVFKGITTSCAVSVVGIPNCRRRRNVMEEPIFLEVEEDEEEEYEINPSIPVEYIDHFIYQII
jgi:hypothetical protein